ncbi:DNA starvation/stationary phase protection protein Dps [Halosimplex salinum]|uniref:DNA starvation/stationary phase protection protein Dps n=1 Tax=Halosimplex salinum TaxID=1710538 RepID=UPI000F4612BB|nr:DNA starvation/stationary phase protection protein Dps [Halosimplex salinum]
MSQMYETTPTPQRNSQHTPQQFSGDTQSGASGSQAPAPQTQAEMPQSQAGMAQGQAGAPTAPVGQLFPTRSYLPEPVRARSIGVLNQCLADLTAIQMQLKSAHWNVKGQEFYQLHALFEDMIEEFEGFVDEVAERASALGGRPPGTAREVAQNTTIPALAPQTVEGMALVSEMADRLAILDANLYEQLETVTQENDLDTADLINEVSRAVAKSLWFLEAHLQSALPAQPAGGAGGGQPAGGLSTTETGIQQSMNSQGPMR